MKKCEFDLKNKRNFCLNYLNKYSKNGGQNDAFDY